MENDDEPLLHLVPKGQGDPSLREAVDVMETLGDGVLIVIAELQRRNTHDAEQGPTLEQIRRAVVDMAKAFPDLLRLARKSAGAAVDVEAIKGELVAWLPSVHADAVAAKDAATKSAAAAGETKQVAERNERDTQTFRTELAAAGDVSKLAPWAQVVEIGRRILRDVAALRRERFWGFVLAFILGFAVYHWFGHHIPK